MTELEQIGQQLGELSKVIYKNEKAFFLFFKLEGSVINHVSFQSDCVRIAWRNKKTQAVQTNCIYFDTYYSFVESLNA